VVTGDDIAYAVAAAAFIVPVVFIVAWITRDEW
jgi:Ca2+/H+ antiporter